MSTPSGTNDDYPTIHFHLDPPPVPRQSRGTGRNTPGHLADEFFLIAHNDSTGRSRLNHTATTYGLVAGLLGELFFAERVTFAQGHLHILDRRSPEDPLQRHVLDRLAVEQQILPIGVWLEFFAADSYEWVAQRLCDAGTVQPQQQRQGLWRRTTTVYVPADTNTAGWAWLRLRGKLRDHEELNPFDLMLVGIAEATRLNTYILDGESAAQKHLNRLLPVAPPALRELCAALETAIGKAATTRRG